MEPVTKEDWAMWKDHKVTQVFFQKLAELREYGIKELGSGVHTDDVARTYLCIGKVNAINAILESDFQEDE